MSNNFIFQGYYVQVQDNILCTKNQGATEKNGGFRFYFLEMEEKDISFPTMSKKGL